MSEAIANYTARVRGFWSTRHELSQTGEDGTPTRLGLLSMDRNWHGMVVRGQYRPEKGEVLTFRRDPGLLRSHFSLWTEGREWLGSSLRWTTVRREVALSTGTKPLQLIPLPGLRPGWRLVASKTGEVARIEGGLRSARIQVWQRVDFEIVIFAYFLGAQIAFESLWPGRLLETESRAASPSKA